MMDFSFKQARLSMFSFLQIALCNPLYAITVIGALARGTFYCFYYRLFRNNITIKLPFRAFSKVKIMGPGRVSIDANCSVALSSFKGLTIVTLSDAAVVAIGKNSNLQGLTVYCRNLVEIGERTMTAYALVQDSFFVNGDKVRSKYKKHLTEQKGVMIGNNVWLSNGVILLSGSRIGDDCVLSLGSAYENITIKTYSLGSGNPAKRSLPIENLLRITGAA